MNTKADSKPVDKQATDTVTIEVDGVELTAPKGSMIIEAADKAGIRIPRFCYHRKLSIAANCRMCLVDVEKAPKPMPACATPVMDGMRVYTQSKRALSAQKNVMEFLLINHPLDCPICDQGGECELQDVSMGYGRSISRFTERKRVVKDENLGSLISTDMTRCIHCTRCVRFLEEIAGTNELGGMGRGETMEIATFIGRSIDSEMSGNIIDLCPVGALTNKPFRYRARAWELRSRTAVAAHDAVGSNLRLHVHGGKILRSVPRDNDAVNESWLSDRDRWGFEGLYAADRAGEPRVKTDGEWRPSRWDEVLAEVGEALRSVDGDDIGFLLSPRASNEELYLAQRLARGLGCGNVDHRLRQRDFADQDALALRPGFETPLARIPESDAVLLVGSNVHHDQPIVGHKVRQAWRKGAKIFALNPMDHGFHFETEARIVAAPTGMIAALAAAAKVAGATGEGRLANLIESAGENETAAAMARALDQAERPLIQLGDFALQSGLASVLRGLARCLAESTGACVNEVPCGANGCGAWSVGAVPHRGAGGAKAAVNGRHVREMLAEPRKVMVLYDVEPSLDCADGARWRAALEEAERVIYLGPWASEEIRELADIIVPLTVQPEVEGSLTNVDGLSQVSTGAGTSHDDSRDGWKVLRVLGHDAGIEAFGYTRIEQVRAEITEILGSADTVETGPAAYAAEPAIDGLELVADAAIYSVDGLVRRSRPLQDSAHAAPAVVRVHPADAGELAGAEQAMVVVGEEGKFMDYAVDERVAPGSAVVPLGVSGTAHLVHAVSIKVLQG